MVTVKNILDSKGRQIFSIRPDQSVLEAMTLMAEKEIGALIVLDGEKTAGIMTERDYARKIILKGRSSSDTQVREIMTTKVIHAQPATTVEKCRALMSEKKIRHLPVLEDGKLCGMLSIRDLMKAIIDDQQYTIEQLERFITS